MPLIVSENSQHGNSWPEDVLDDDFIAHRVASGRKHAWLVAAPKSGSTWLTILLEQLLGWQSHTLVDSYDRREQEIDIRRMLMYPDVDLFSIQQHCRFSTATYQFVQRFNVRVILQGRNLWDTLVSLRDHLVKESLVTPICFVDEAFLSHAPDRQMDWVIDLAVPWYFNFYASWFTGRQRGEVEFLWVNYESLFRDTAGQLQRIIDYLGVSRSEIEIESAIHNAVDASTRLNVGRTGRGEEMLTQAQKDRIARLRSFYSQLDFTSIGLG